MMHRRTLLSLFGIGAAAAVLPAVALAKPVVTRSLSPMRAVADSLGDHLVADVYYHVIHDEWMVVECPATVAYRECPGRPYEDNVIVSFNVERTGIVMEVRLRNGNDVLVTLDPSQMDTTTVVCGQTVNIKLGLS